MDFLFLTFAPLVGEFQQQNAGTELKNELLKKVDSTQKPLESAVFELTKISTIYDPAYFSIPYPNGDIPQGKGVCTNLVIRAYRKVDLELQMLEHEDMQLITKLAILFV